MNGDGLYERNGLAQGSHLLDCSLDPLDVVRPDGMREGLVSRGGSFLERRRADRKGSATETVDRFAKALGRSSGTRRPILTANSPRATHPTPLLSAPSARTPPFFRLPAGRTG